MQIVHLAAADHGGAGTAAKRLHEALRDLGHRSRMLVFDRRSDDADVLPVAADDLIFRWRHLAQKAWLKVSSRPEGHFQNQRLSPHPQAATLLGQLGFEPDIIVVHFISQFLSADDVLALQRASGAPVLWNLLDMGLLTGGCHYAWRCEGYHRRCGSCPMLRWAGPNDASARTWAAKHGAVVCTRGWVVAGSSWLARQAARSSLFAGRPIETLLIGVSPQRFAPGDTAALRVGLGVAGGEPLVFFGAQRFDQRRKGMHLLMSALAHLAKRKAAMAALPVLLAAGDAADFVALRELGYRLVELGHVDGATLARCYAAANVFACPSIEDSGPMMINEAMMCGTPVVAFRMGVAEDLIEHGTTGMLAALADAESFAEGLQRVLGWSGDERAVARRRCREMALDKLDPRKQAERFIGIAERLVHGELQQRDAVA